MKISKYQYAPRFEEPVDQEEELPEDIDEYTTRRKQNGKHSRRSTDTGSHPDGTGRRNK